LFALGILALVLLAAFFWQATTAPRIRTVLYDPALTDVVTNSLARTPAGPFRWTFTEQELTAAAHEAVSDASLSEPSIACEPGSLVASGRYTWGAISFPVTARLQPRVVKGHLKVALLSLAVGQISVPGFIRDRLIRQVLNLLSGIRLSNRDTITSVEVVRGSLTIRAVRAPSPNPKAPGK